ncbi:hypothetical protein FQA39_LY18838 [Lamprigera yunnana]|nr:hypothetical protein FQA39_LY18838 [Lamprigera yunnana]
MLAAQFFMAQMRLIQSQLEGMVMNFLDGIGHVLWESEMLAANEWSAEKLRSSRGLMLNLQQFGTWKGWQEEYPC